MTKIVSYNVNGIRSAVGKGLIDWLKQTDADIVCLQEIKAMPEQVDKEVHDKLHEHTYWYPAQKKGYSGVAIFSKKKPNHVEYGCGIKPYDDEGRVIRADYDGFSVMSVYFPSGTSGDERQDFKYKFLDDFQLYIDRLKKIHPNLIICGDYNICHKPIDIHNPVANANSTGFLPEERAWLDKFFKSGFIDTFRHFNTEPHNYTWWSFRANARAKNLGWRIDYQAVSSPLGKKLKRAVILPEAKHSDHCPILLEID
ncbi:MAG TPA: exodeoxyribonuclease III [Bacteroidia bacterium]|nr:exodeoxyribonuclease III [Bacteroidia bacterium]